MKTVVEVETLHHLYPKTVFRYQGDLYVIATTKEDQEDPHYGQDNIHVRCIARHGDEHMTSMGGMFSVENSHIENFNAYNQVRLIDGMWTVV